MKTWTFTDGWLMRTWPASCLVLGLLVLAVNALAAPARAGETLDLELLEFLGEWQLENGEFVDPLAVDDLALPDEAGSTMPSPTAEGPPEQGVPDSRSRTSPPGGGEQNPSGTAHGSHTH